MHHFFLAFLALFLLSSQVSCQIEEEIQRSDFPDNFFFGTATSSYQVEGAYLEDGKGISNWDVFSHIPGKTKKNETGDVADDHYHRFLEDVDLMHSMGINAYRFSISWARILPNGSFGEINMRGVAFYNKVIDYLLTKGIQPFVTIHHNDLPYELDKRYGGWLSSNMQEDFVHYAKICFQEFGDRVKHWMTINEPNIVALLAYVDGLYPRGYCSLPFGNCYAGNSDIEPLVATHNMLLAHAKAVHLYRSRFQPKQGGAIGIVADAHMFEPLRDEELDRQAVDRALASNLAWVYDPIVYGDYPSEMRELLGGRLPRFSAAEKKLLKDSVDFIGVNHYTTLYAMDCLHSSCPDGGDGPLKGFIYTTGYRRGVPIGPPAGVPGFFVVPRGMEKTINYVKERYPTKPIFVTENGFSPLQIQDDNVEDIMNDLPRIKFHKSYLAALARAMRTGADVRGYFIWSMMDNFEWMAGYGIRFGLFYVDRRTLERLPKLSAKWFAAFLSNRSGQVKEQQEFVDLRPERKWVMSENLTLSY